MDAEHDATFLDECFVDTGDLGLLTDMSKQNGIILGRTGSGKTALLLSLRRHCENHEGLVIEIRPDDLSFNYINNSTILQHLTELNVNLDPFFKLLWKHVFAVSIFQARFGLTDERTQTNWLYDLFDSKETKQKKRLEEANKRKAVEYVQRWGNRFWEATDVRVKEIVSHFEDEVNTQVSSRLGTEGKAVLAGSGVSVTGNQDETNSGTMKSATTISSECIENAKRVINAIQGRELTGILELIQQVLPDRQKPCFILIDRLDEAWAEDGLRIRLMKALLETLYDFSRQVNNAKVVLCFRIDLLERVFREMRNEQGFQEDKYRSLYVPLTWSDSQLTQLLDSRVKQLVKDQYTNYQPTAKDLLPERLGNVKGNGLNYLLERTWKRPRDAIEFFNICIQKAKGKAKIDKAALSLAEGDYSKSRFRSIGAEWEHQYPGLLQMAQRLLAKRRKSFPVEELTDEELWAWAEECFSTGKPSSGLLFEQASLLIETSNYDVLRCFAAWLFYKVGMVGLRLDVRQPINWAGNTSETVSISEVLPSSRMDIHLGLWRALGVIDS